MNSVFKAVITFLISSQAFAITTMNQSEMVDTIQKLKAEVSNECSSEQSKELLSGLVSNQCPKTGKFLKTNYCNRKKDLVIFFEGVMSNGNILDVTKRFNAVPPADALGGVLLYQMRNSIDQVNETWIRQVKQVRSRCVTGNLKKHLTDYTQALREDIKQTTLLVNPPVQ